MIVFTDFDGTITTEDTFVKMIKNFTPELAQQLLPKLYNRTITLREGVRLLLESIPSQKYQELIDFIRPEPRTKGFVEFVDFLQQRNIKLVVISGGLKIMVETVLAELLPKITAVHAIELDRNQKYLQVHSDFEHGTELVAKVEVIKAYKPQEFIVIGDSITDLNMSLYAPLVFAKYPLTKYLDENQKAYKPWDNFFDIINYLESINFKQN